MPAKNYHTILPHPSLLPLGATILSSLSPHTLQRVPWDQLEQLPPKQSGTGGSLPIQGEGHHFASAIISWQEAIMSGHLVTHMLTYCPAAGCQCWQHQRRVTSASSLVGCLFPLGQRDPRYKYISIYMYYRFTVNWDMKYFTKMKKYVSYFEVPYI